MYSFKAVINASHTSGMVLLITCFDILNMHIRVWYESPVARNRIVIASRSWGGIACLNFVFFLVIWGAILLSKSSKSVDVIRKQFLKPASTLYSKFKTSVSSITKSLTRSLVQYLLRLFKLGRIQNLRGNFGRSTAPTITTNAAANNTSSSEDILALYDNIHWRLRF